MTAFEEYASCPWERQTLPVDHVCVADAQVPCEDRAENGQVCGTCTACISAGEAHLKRLDDDAA